MKFNFELNEVPNVNVEFEFDQKWGKIFIRENGTVKLKSQVLIGGDKMYRTTIAGKRVEIEMEMPLLLALIKKKKYRVYVDGVKYKQFNAKGQETSID